MNVKARGEGEEVTAVVAAGGASYKEQVSEQYKVVYTKTGEFFREVVKFGAILNEVEMFLGEGRGRGNGGSGLQGWLAENCPEVNYKTAMGYKGWAEKCATMIGGGYQALAVLQGKDTIVPPGKDEAIDVEAKFVEKREALFATVDSRRSLEQMYFDFLAGQKKAGRPNGSKNKPGEFVMDPPEKQSERIWAEFSRELDSAAMDSIQYLDPKIAGIMAETFRRFANAFEKRAK